MSEKAGCYAQVLVRKRLWWSCCTGKMPRNGQVSGMTTLELLTMYSYQILVSSNHERCTDKREGGHEKHEQASHVVALLGKW